VPTDRRDLRRRLVAVAATQSGHFTAAQALSVGYSYQAQKFHADHGNWLKIDRGIYRLPEWPVGEHDDLVRWSLWGRHRAVVSHDTALAVHDLGDANPAVVHLTVPSDFRSRAPEGVYLHRAELNNDDIWQYEGFALTTPLRTLLDLAAGTLDLDQLADTAQRTIRREPAILAGLTSKAESFGPRAALRIDRALRIETRL
jgi:predicted transcriptional regulator of viral defense system